MNTDKIWFTSDHQEVKDIISKKNWKSPFEPRNG